MSTPQRQEVVGPPPATFYCVLDAPFEVRGAQVRLVGRDGVDPGRFRAYGEPDFNHTPKGVPEIMVVTERQWWRYVMSGELGTPIEFPPYVWWPATHVFTTG